MKDEKVKAPRPQTAPYLWWLVWRALADFGYLDAWGSNNQRRVTAQWVKDGRPAGVAEYMLQRADVHIPVS